MLCVCVCKCVHWGVLGVRGADRRVELAMGIKVQGVWVWSLLLPEERCPGLSALSLVARPGQGSHPGLPLPPFGTLGAERLESLAGVTWAKLLKPSPGLPVCRKLWAMGPAGGNCPFVPCASTSWGTSWGREEPGSWQDWSLWVSSLESAITVPINGGTARVCLGAPSSHLYPVLPQTARGPSPWPRIRTGYRTCRPRAKWKRGAP